MAVVRNVAEEDMDRLVAATLNVGLALVGLSSSLKEFTGKYTFHNDHGTSIDDLGLTIRPSNGLHSENIHTLGDLLNTPESELRLVSNLGRKSLAEIKSVLAERGLSLKP